MSGRGARSRESGLSPLSVPNESDQDEPVVPMIRATCHAHLIASLYRDGRWMMATRRRSYRPGLLLWFNTAVKLRARMLALERGIGSLAGEEMTVRPEDTLREAGISTKRQAKYQRRMSTLLGKRDT
jgi:hypothetical protein